MKENNCYKCPAHARKLMFFVLLKNLKTFYNFYTTILNHFKQTLNKKTPRYDYVSYKYWGVYGFFCYSNASQISHPNTPDIHPGFIQIQTFRFSDAPHVFA